MCVCAWGVYMLRFKWCFADLVTFFVAQWSRDFALMAGTAGGSCLEYFLDLVRTLSWGTSSPWIENASLTA